MTANTSAPLSAAEIQQAQQRAEAIANGLARAFRERPAGIFAAPEGMNHCEVNTSERAAFIEIATDALQTCMANVLPKVRP
jgi:hypothetical protein